MRKLYIKKTLKAIYGFALILGSIGLGTVMAKYLVKYVLFIWDLI
jgi:hypothetical protein